MNDQLSTIIGNRYRLLSPIGAGGMGAVFRAYDRLTQQVVALKRVVIADDPLDSFPTPITPSQDAMLALAEEFKTLASLKHPNVINVLDYGFDGLRQPYFTMLLLEGAQRISDYGKDQPLLKQVDLLIQTLQALAYVHRLGILHRDLKPDNVQVVNGEVKVLDFGLAIMRRNLTPNQSETTAGTLSYIAPEILQGMPPSEASDLYGVGVIAYEMFTGVHPFKADTLLQIIDKSLNLEPDMSTLEFPDATPLAKHRVIAVLKRLLVKDPTQRFIDANQVIQSLCEAVDQPMPDESGAVRESFLQAARLVGRDQELARFDESLHSLVHNHIGSAWLIAGESGVGKSRLLDMIRIRGLINSALVLRGQAVKNGASYHLWREVVRRLLLVVDISDLDKSILKEIVPDIEQLLECSVANAPDVDSAIRGQRLMLTVERLFRQCPSPMLLILEDLHWADNDLDLLKILVQLKLPLMIVGSFRNDEQPTLAEQLPQMQLIKLQRLNHSEIAELSEAILGETGREPKILQFLERETEGNTFFLVEVIRALAQSVGHLQDITPELLPATVFSGGVKAVVHQRLMRIPEIARPLLQLAALAGRQIDILVIRHLAENLGHISLDHWLTLCANAAVLDAEDGQWRFAHDKLREGVLTDVDSTRHPALHRQIAEAIEAVYSDNEQQVVALLAHWAQAGDTAKQAHYAQLAGDQALRISAFKQALTFYKQTLDQVSEDNPDRLMLLLRIGETNRQLGEFTEAQKYLNMALLLAHQPHDRATILYQMSQVAISTGDLAKGQQQLLESEVLARQVNNTLLLAQVLYGLGDVAWRQGNLDLAKAMVSQSLTLAREAKQPPQILYALNRLGAIHLDLHDHDQARQFYAEGKALASQTGNRERLAAITMNAGLIDYFEEHYEQAKTSYEEGLKLAEEVGNQHLVAAGLLNMGDVLLHLLDTVGAEKYLTNALALTHQLGAVSLSLVTLTNIGALRSQLGDYEGALELFGLVRSHPAADANTYQEQTRFLKALEGKLTQAQITQGLERGATLDFDTVIQTILNDQHAE